MNKRVGLCFTAFVSQVPKKRNIDIVADDRYTQWLARERAGIKERRTRESGSCTKAVRSFIGRLTSDSSNKTALELTEDCIENINISMHNHRVRT